MAPRRLQRILNRFTSFTDQGTFPRSATHLRCRGSLTVLLRSPNVEASVPNARSVAEDPLPFYFVHNRSGNLPGHTSLVAEDPLPFYFVHLEALAARTLAARCCRGSLTVLLRSSIELRGNLYLASVAEDPLPFYFVHLFLGYLIFT